MTFSRYISLIITILLYLGTLLINSVDIILADQKFIYGVIALSITIFSIFLKRGIWIYIFSVSLILVFLDLISMYTFSFGLQLGSFNMNLVTLILMLLHFAFNVDTLSFRKKR